MPPRSAANQRHLGVMERRVFWARRFHLPRMGQAKALTEDAVRRIASNITELPELTSFAAKSVAQWELVIWAHITDSGGLSDVDRLITPAPRPQRVNIGSSVITTTRSAPTASRTADPSTSPWAIRARTAAGNLFNMRVIR